MLQQILKLFLCVLSPFIFCFFVVIMVFIGYIFYYIIIKKVKIKKSNSSYKKDSFFKRILFMFPKRLALDFINKDPNFFQEYGLHMFVGEQGSGKTISVIHKLLQLQQKYPKCKVRTNMCYLYQDGSLEHWKQLIKNSNAEYGQVEVLDEIQTWFSSNQSKNFPAEMLTEISQQRKQRKMLVGTAQIFSRIAKPIREQVTHVYCPLTIFGCLTVVRVTKPQYWDNEKQCFKKFIKNYFFIHTEEMRESYDTYKKINKYKKIGFQENKNVVEIN